MLLTKSKSRCSEHQSRIISEENGRRHCAVNEHSYSARQYKLDGDVVRNELSCDYLVLNDSQKRAFFIELKGSDISHAVKQLEHSIALCNEELPGYQILLRIIAKKARTHELDSLEIRKLKRQYKGDLVIRSVQYEENL